MRKLGIICLFFIVLAGCTKKTNTIFKKVNIGMQRSEVEKLIGKGDNVNIPYKEENMAYIYTYINDTLTAITYEPINKNKKDSTLSIGILDKFIFQTVRGGTATLIGVSIGNFSINCSESTSFIKPLLNDQDLLTYGVSSSHIFCVTGALDTERKSIIAKKIEDMSFKNKGVIDSTKHVIDLRPFKAEPVIINNEIYLLYSRVLLKAKYEN